MSKLVNFVVNAPATIRRAPAYFVNQTTNSKDQPFLPDGKKIPRQAACKTTITKDSCGESVFMQVRSVFANYYRYIGQIPSRKSLDRQVKQISLHYEDLQKLGFDIQDVTTFRLRHAKALLAKWQAVPCTPNTVYSRWSGLRTWARVLGKNGMLCQLKDLQPGFDRRPAPGSISHVLTSDQLASRSNYLQSKPDLTVYLVDRMHRELGLSREDALKVELDAVKGVVEGKASVLRVGTGGEQKNVPKAQLYLPLLTQIRDFMVSRNRKALAWSHLNLDAALQKYTLRLSYVNRTLFSKEKRGGQATAQKGGVA